MSNELFSQLQGMVDDEGYQKILVSLIQEDENLVLKTDIRNPLALAQLKTVAGILRTEGNPDLAELIELFITDLLRYAISRNRLSREEIIKALTEGLKQDRSTVDKLVERPA